jgi:COP9 signalosome complex subunit 6
VQAQLSIDFECDSPVFVLLHANLLNEGSDSHTGKLPFTIYETFIPPQTSMSGEEMEVEYTDVSQALKYRSLVYTLDTSPDEAIALRDVVEMAGIASIQTNNTVASKQVDPAAFPSQDSKKSKSAKGKSKTKALASAFEGDGEVNLDLLSPSDEECKLDFDIRHNTNLKVIAALTAKSNAIKMLKSRLAVISAYLRSQLPPSSPPSYLSDPSLPVNPSAIPKSTDLEILRTASALATQLQLVPPSEFLAFEKETLQAKTDVELVTLLSTLTQKASAVMHLGKRWSMVERGKAREKGPGRGGELSAVLTEQLKSL